MGQNGKNFLGGLSMRQKLFKTAKTLQAIQDVLLKWLGGSSVKEKYCKAHLETERNKTSSPRVVLKDLNMIENEKGIYF